MQKPAISVVMPAFNAEKYIGSAISSLLTQTFENFELIIVDDGSSDGTLEAVKIFATDSRIKLLKNENNSGAGISINRGINAAEGQFIAIAHADDICLPPRLGIQLNYLKNHPDVGVVGSWAWEINNKGERIRKLRQISDSSQIACLIWRQSPLLHPTAMIRRDILKAYPYSERRVAEDYELWVRLTKLAVKIANLPIPLVEYRSHSLQTSKLRMQEEEEECFKIFQSWHPTSNLSFTEYRALTFKSYELSFLQRLQLLKKLQRDLGIGTWFAFIDCLKYQLMKIRSKPSPAHFY